MTDPLPPEASDEMDLRAEALRRRKEGPPPQTRGWWTISPDTLALLYRLASQPERAGDALKLLHELQTHQIELDLQNERSQANEQELRNALDHYRSLFEQAPVGYFLVGFDGRIIETNSAGASLLGRAAPELTGQSFDEFLESGSRTPLRTLLETLANGAARATCRVRCVPLDNEPQLLRVDAKSAPGQEAGLLVMTRAEG